MPAASVLFVGTFITVGFSSSPSLAKGTVLLLTQASLPVSVICSEKNDMDQSLFTIILCRTLVVNAQSVVRPMSFPSVYDSIANARDNYYCAAYMIKRNLDALRSIYRRKF